MAPMNPAGANAWVLVARIVPQVGGLMRLGRGSRFLDPATLGSCVLIFAWTELLRRLVRAGWREAGGMDRSGEATPAIATLAGLAADRQLAAYRHDGFWQCMDTLREKNLLESLWQSGKRPWKTWED